MQVGVILLGVGGVGQALIRQMLSTRAWLVERLGLVLQPAGLLDSRAMLFDRQGLPAGTLRAALDVKGRRGSLAELDGSRSPDALAELLESGQILVDLTASLDTGRLVRAVLAAGCGVVTANKHPLGAPWADSRQLFQALRLRYEATVGAGLPVIRTLRTLLDTGDEITRMEGCFSGTLGYLCSQLERGAGYSAAVRQAHALGFTEPDPREDLSGRDVARKALILARTAGWPLEMADLAVEALFPETMLGCSVGEFMDRLSTLDDDISRRSDEAATDGQALRYVAQVDAHGGRVGLEPASRQSVLGALHGPANYVAFYTRRYAEVPLVISGPGAGQEVTAAGVLGDIIDLAADMAGRREEE